MSKLLTERELRDEVSNIVYTLHCKAFLDEGMRPNMDYPRDAVRLMMSLLKSQKLAHADMVIGEYSQYPGHFNTSDVLHEQRERNRL